MIAEKLESRKSTAYEIVIISKSGSRVSLELSTRLITIDGVPVGIQGIGRDITSRKEAELSLHKAVSLSLLHSNPRPMGSSSSTATTKIPRTIRNLSRSGACRPMSSTVRMNTNSLSFPRAKQRIQKVLSDLGGFTRSNGCFDSHDRNDRRANIYERYSQPQFLEGKPVGSVCCFRDVTERELAEEKLRHYALHDTLTSLT